MATLFYFFYIFFFEIQIMVHCRAVLSVIGDAQATLLRLLHVALRHAATIHTATTTTTTTTIASAMATAKDTSALSVSDRYIQHCTTGTNTLMWMWRKKAGCQPALSLFLSLASLSIYHSLSWTRPLCLYCACC